MANIDLVLIPAGIPGTQAVEATLSPRLATRLHGALTRILDTQQRTLLEEDFGALALTRDLLSGFLLTGKPRSGCLDEY